MRKTTCILPGLMLLVPAGGCSLFRGVSVSRQDSSYTGSIKHSLDWKIDSTQLASRVFSFTDSSGAQFEVEIVPSGPFTFSSQSGFAGSASLVRLRGKTKTNIRSTDSSSQQLHVQSSGSLKQNAKIKTETTQKKKTTTGNNRLWWFLALMAICLLFFVVVKKEGFRRIIKLAISWIS